MRSRSSPCSPVISASAMTSAVTPTATPERRDQRDERDERLLPLARAGSARRCGVRRAWGRSRLQAPGSGLQAPGSSGLRPVSGTAWLLQLAQHEPRSREAPSVPSGRRARRSLSIDIRACFPPTERYGLQSQLRRAAVSVATNIVEGSRPPVAALTTRASSISRSASASETDYLLDLCLEARSALEL